MRRCLHLPIPQPDEEQLSDMVAAHFADHSDRDTAALIHRFLQHREVNSQLAADQLLNAVYLATSGAAEPDSSWDHMLDLLWQKLQPKVAVD
jgi:hypothetical protein